MEHPELGQRRLGQKQGHVAIDDRSLQLDHPVPQTEVEDHVKGRVMDSSSSKAEGFILPHKFRLLVDHLDVANGLAVVRALRIFVPVSLFATAVAEGLALHQLDLLVPAGIGLPVLRLVAAAPVALIAPGLGLLLVSVLGALVGRVGNGHILRNAILQVRLVPFKAVAVPIVGHMRHVSSLASRRLPRLSLTTVM